MSRKRFEQIEASKPDETRKKSFFNKIKFKRKLELDGVEREKLSSEVKVEPVSLVQEIEDAEQAKLSRKVQPKVAQEKKRVVIDRQFQLDMAKEKAQQAKSTLFWGFISIVVAVFVLYQFRKTSFTERGSFDFVFFVLLIVVAVFGRKRGNWW